VDPLIEFGEDAGRVAQLEVFLPAAQIRTESFVTRPMLRPPFRLVICRTRCFIAIRALAATRSLTRFPGATQKL
jgi:hypothetical protein